MKAKILLCLVLLCGTMHLFGQTIDKSVYYNTYVFLTSETLPQCNADGSDITVDGTKNPTQNIPINSKFKITKIVDQGNLVIQVLPWVPKPTSTDSSPKNAARNSKYKELNKKLVSTKTDNTTGVAADQDVYLKLPAGTFASDCNLLVPPVSFTVGILTLPIKMRFGDTRSDGTVIRDFTFTNDVNIGLSFGIKFSSGSSGRYSNNILTGISLTSVGVTPEDTKMSVSTATNLAAITWHFGYLYQIDNFQLGAFTGVDYLSGATGRMWNYRNEMWLGIGVGYSLFASKKTTDTQ